MTNSTCTVAALRIGNRFFPGLDAVKPVLKVVVAFVEEDVVIAVGFFLDGDRLCIESSAMHYKPSKLTDENSAERRDILARHGIRQLE